MDILGGILGWYNAYMYMPAANELFIFFDSIDQYGIMGASLQSFIAGFSVFIPLYLLPVACAAGIGTLVQKFASPLAGRIIDSLIGGITILVLPGAFMFLFSWFLASGPFLMVAIPIMAIASMGREAFQAV